MPGKRPMQSKKINAGFHLLFSAVFLFTLNALPLYAASALKDYGLRDYVYLSKSLPHSENSDWSLVCQLPYNAQFQPWLEVESTAGKIIKIDSTNPLVTYLQPTQQYPTKAGIQTWEASKWISGQGVRIPFPRGSRSAL